MTDEANQEPPMSDRELIAELDYQLEYEDLHAPLEAAIMAMRNRLANPPKAHAREGWVMVPREPTEAMIKAARDQDDDLRAQGINGAEVEGVWEAMLSADPAQGEG